MRFPVSFAQRRLWLLGRRTAGEAAFHLAYAIRLDGPVDADALRRAMDALVARHAMLRTGIVGAPEQVVAETASVPIDRVTLPDGVAVEPVVADLAGRPFDLACPPLLRAALIETGADRHVFVLVLHQLVGDAATMAILLTELSTVYRSELAGTPAELAPLWMDYGDYAVWQLDRLRGEELARQLDFWRERLRGAPRALTPAAGRDRTARGARTSAALDPAATGRLPGLARAAGATPAEALLTGYAVVLARYARRTDLVIGIPVAGRIRVELTPIAGPFADTVPLRVSLAGDPTFAELLARVRDAAARARAHDELPFQKLTEELGPLPDVRFAESLPVPALDLPGVAARGRILSTGTATHDLTLLADTSNLVLEYRTGLFDAAFAEEFVRSVAAVLNHAAAAPDTPVADLPVAELGPPGDLGELDVLRSLRESAATVTDGAATVPMSAVCDRAARLARVLAEAGAGPETRVGVCLGRGTGMLTALLGVWWAGAAFVPLDPEFPLARLEVMARDAGLRLVVSDRDHAGLAGSLGAGVAVVTVDDLPDEPLAPVPVCGDALAYTVFISGSTGPIGVDVGHRAVANLLAGFRHDLGLGVGDRFVAVTPISSDLALPELLLPPVCGADLVIATAGQARETGELRSLIERSAATAMHATPHTWRLLLSGGGVPAGLRLRLCTGGAFSDAVTTPWNLYGTTETTVWSAAGPVEISPIGNTRVYVLDERLAPVPAGVVGEVHIAGAGVARGYLGWPGRTAAVFRPDPWGAEPGARMYATGDLGRWGEGGGLELVGRAGHRVTIRGFPVDRGEVEAVLRAHRAVREAAVIRAPGAGEPALVAYVVPDPDGPAARPEADLLALFRPHLRAALPDHMIPAVIASLPAFPLTPNGMVDRAALPAAEWAAPPAEDRVPPRDAVEATMARIWADLLRTAAPIGVHDNLFGLGAGSLTAIRFAARIADTYGVNLPMHRIVATPTIAELAELVSADPP